MKRAKTAATVTVDSTALLKAVENTYEDSRFFVGCGVLDDCDFTQGLARNRSDFTSRATLIDMIKACEDEQVDSMPEFPDYLVLNPKTYVSLNSIIENQIYHTDAPDRYYHSVSKYNPHLDVYIHIDRENMSISFMLGDKQKELKLVLDRIHTYKLLKTKMYCSSVDGLEGFIKDEFWNPLFIQVGRKALGLDVCELLKA